MSERRACSVVGVDRSSVRYRHRRPDDAAGASVCGRWRQSAAVRLPTPRAAVHARSSTNRKKSCGYYGRRSSWCVAAVAASVPRDAGPMTLREDRNQRWSLDFWATRWPTAALPHPGSGGRLHAGVLCLVADTSTPATRRPRMDAIVARRTRPLCCVSDNGTELTSMRSCAGRPSGGSPGITSRPASRHRTPSWRASTGGFVTNASTRRCSPRWRMPA